MCLLFLSIEQAAPTSRRDNHTVEREERTDPRDRLITHNRVGWLILIAALSILLGGSLLIAFYGGGLGLPIALLAGVALTAAVNLIRACRDVMSDPYWVRLRGGVTARMAAHAEQARLARRAARAHLRGGTVTREHLALMMREGDFSAADYETLVALDAADPEWSHFIQGASTEEISALPTFRFAAKGQHSAPPPRLVRVPSSAAASMAHAPASRCGSSGEYGAAAAESGVSATDAAAFYATGVAADDAAAAAAVGATLGEPVVGLRRVVSSGSLYARRGHPLGEIGGVGAIASTPHAAAAAASATAAAVLATAVSPRDTHLECAVCLERFVPHDEVSILPCMHYYHLGCITPWLLTKATCPVCKISIRDPMFDE